MAVLKKGPLKPLSLGLVSDSDSSDTCPGQTNMQSYVCTYLLLIQLLRPSPLNLNLTAGHITSLEPYRR